MRKKIRQVMEHPLISGSIIVFLGSLLANIFNFLFNIFMSRNLTFSDYGALASLISIITLFGFSAAGIVPTIVRFAGSYFAKGEVALVRGLFLRMNKTLFLVGAVIFAIFVLYSHNIGEFFKISDEFLIILVGLNVFAGFIFVINQALLQAKLDFIFLSIVIFIGAFLKFVVGVSLVFTGFAVGGAMLAFFVAGLIPYCLTFLRLPFLLHRSEKKTTINFATMFKYAGPATLTFLGLTSFISTDIILVKHFFDPVQAGVYATLSLIGRVIFFFSAPIGTVMFPLIVQKHTKKENYHSIFILSLLLVFTASAVLTIFYFLFPEFMLYVFSKKEEAILAAPLVGFFGMYVATYSMLFICTNFYLSIKKTKVFIPVLLGAILQGILIWFFHETFFHIIAISLGITGLLLILLLLYYLKLYGETK